MNTPSSSASVSSPDSIAHFEAIYQEYHDSIARYIWTLLPPSNKEEADNLSQEVFLRVWRHIDKLCTLEKHRVLSWLLCVARHLVSDLNRYNKKRIYLSIEGEGAATWLLSQQEFEQQVEDREIIQKCLTAIPQKHLPPLYCDVQGIREDEVKENVSYHAAKMRLIRAKRACREAYAQEIAS